MATCLVVAAENQQVTDWDSFVEWVMNSHSRHRRFRSPSAVAVVLSKVP